jgi:small subunit ribosomal protein S15
MAKISKSNKDKEKPLWLKYTADELKAIILKLANKGLTAEKIGLVLRDQYGIPKVSLYGFKIKEILVEKDKYEDPTLKNLKLKKDKITSHNKKNKQDKTSERSLIITKAKIKKIEEYNNIK